MGEIYCDICGRTPVKAQILLEGAKLLACGRCMRDGKILHRLDDDRPQSAPQRKSAVASTEEIIEGYGKIIRTAREKAKLPLAVIAERIREKESYLNGIENERLIPTLEVAKKLEKELKIKLVETVQESGASADVVSQKKFSEPTLGDLLTAKKKES